VAAGRAREAQLAQQCDDSPADPGGRWSAKDHLIHLSSWRDYAASLLDAVRTGTTDRLPPPEDEDATNAKLYAANKDRSAADIVREAAASWDRLEAAIRECSEDDLTAPHPRSPEAQVWQTVPGNGHGHVAQHLMFRHLDAGDVNGAEEVQIWCHDVDFQAFADAKPRAFADYNLACFYARIGREEMAANLLRHSFEGAPGLKALAGRDPDLDPIRDSKPIQELLAG